MRFLAVVLVVIIGCSWVLAEPVLGDVDLIGDVVDVVVQLPADIISFLTDKLTLVEGVLDNGYRFLGIPLESFLKIKDALTEALLDENLLDMVTFPLVDSVGLQILSKEDFLEKFYDGVFKNLVFPLIDLIGNIILTKTELEAALLGKLIDIVAALLGIALNSKVSFPVTDDVGFIIPNLNGIISAILNFVIGLTDNFGTILPNINAAWQAFLIAGLNQPLFPITDGSEQIFANIKAFLNALIKGITFPLKGVTIVINTAVNLITFLLTGSLPFPLTDATGILFPDFPSLLAYLISRLVYPLTTVGGSIILNQDQLLLTLLIGFLQSLFFPLQNTATGLVLANPAALLEQILSSLLKPPIRDSADRVFKNILDFLSALLDGRLGIPNLPSTNLPIGTPDNILSLLQRILNVLESVTLPIKNSAGLIITSLLNFLEVVLTAFIFPIIDAVGKVLSDPLILINAILQKAVKFPLIDAADKVITSLNDFLISVVEGLKIIGFPLTDAEDNVIANPTVLLRNII